MKKIEHVRTDFLMMKKRKNKPKEKGSWLLYGAIKIAPQQILMIGARQGKSMPDLV